MERVIESLIEQRKTAQNRLKETLHKLSGLVAGSGFFRSSKKELASGLSRLSEEIDSLILSYSREWDAYSNNHNSKVLHSLTNKIDKLSSDYSQAKSLMNNFMQLEDGLNRMILNLDRQADSQTEKIKEAAELLSPHQYADFEQRFRGDREKILQKLTVYLKYFENRDNILDIGCGRGEFLELLKEQGKKGFGIDTSNSMLSAAKEKGLSCIQKDALSHLKSLETASLGGIFSSQVIEHLSPDYLRAMVIEAFRVLKEDGLLVLETINPLSLFALSRIFYLDITHQKPLHPEYMRYLTETSGFSEVDIIYSEGEMEKEKLVPLSASAEYAQIYNENVDKLNNILYASAEYAVIGTKK